MLGRKRDILLMGGLATLAGCAIQPSPFEERFPPTAAGIGEEVIVDDSDSTFFFEGPWVTSSASSGYLGEGYHVISKGQGDNYAVWNLELIDYYEIYVRWTSHSNRASNASYEVHHLDEANRLVVDTVTLDQRSGGGEWFKLGTYKMSTLTGRVQLIDDADGYVVADAVRFVPVSLSVAEPVAVDSDGDGMDDAFETQFGLNPDDPSDATADSDGDGVTNLEEYYVRTDPTNSDTDSDGIPDSYELSYGLNATVSDASGDLDGDGYTNLEEYEGGTAANSEASFPGRGIYVSWDPPTTREDGSQLDLSDISYYVVRYYRDAQPPDVLIDNESGFFEIVGATVAPSSHTPGYWGENYYPIPPGNGEVFGKWSFYDLVPGAGYLLQARWTAGFNRSQQATYNVTFVDDSGTETTQTEIVDQTLNGGVWVDLVKFTSGQNTAVVRLGSEPDGYIIADAIKLTGSGATDVSVVEVRDNQTSVRITEELQPGVWFFEVKAVDTAGNESAYSPTVTVQVQ
ncbi:hypothetical protein BKP64_04625 [Marinobacter salinus]|uniref:Golvesin/Xly CBD-like domain-containing protein n=1 Tax=Marinobacter salinus TaxID=1874317 RepID=A0A1D9GIT1_9GAMM|nr:hypothetical protein [Marinobacter salinus]AOY87513.1 hypothetical protein BKP64_04625 [Marinobacter salinus]